MVEKLGASLGTFPYTSASAEPASLGLRPVYVGGGEGREEEPPLPLSTPWGSPAPALPCLQAPRETEKPEHQAGTFSDCGIFVDPGGERTHGGYN